MYLPSIFPEKVEIFLKIKKNFLAERIRAAAINSRRHFFLKKTENFLFNFF